MQYKVASRKLIPNNDSRKFVREHVLIAEKKLGRKLENGEVVHHIDGNKHNNNPDNLMIFASNSDHSAFHKGADIYEENGLWYSVQKKLVCEYCKNTFSPLHRRQYSHVYCSYECARLASIKCDIDRESMFNLIKDLNGNFVEAGRRLGITDNAVRKKCKKFGIPCYSSFYKNMGH